jgi:hypothetical protein
MESLKQKENDLNSSIYENSNNNALYRKAKSKDRERDMEECNNLTKETIQEYTHLPLHEACIALNVDEVCLKQRCRDLKILRWPYRKRAYDSKKMDLYEKMRIQKQNKTTKNRRKNVKSLFSEFKLNIPKKSKKDKDLINVTQIQDHDKLEPKKMEMREEENVSGILKSIYESVQKLKMIPNTKTLALNIEKIMKDDQCEVSQNSESSNVDSLSSLKDSNTNEALIRSKETHQPQISNCINNNHEYVSNEYKFQPRILESNNRSDALNFERGLESKTFIMPINTYKTSSYDAPNFTDRENLYLAPIYPPHYHNYKTHVESLPQLRVRTKTNNLDELSNRTYYNSDYYYHQMNMGERSKDLHFHHNFEHENKFYGEDIDKYYTYYDGYYYKHFS